jgi:hypothetical protein
MKNLIVQKGVYRHDIYGPYDSIDSAIDDSKNKILSESDHYHFYEVLVIDDETKLLESVCTVRWNEKKQEFETIYRG